MIRDGFLGDVTGYLCYMDAATQEEAERLSGDKEEEGIIIFIPYPSPFDEFMKRHIHDANE